VSFAVVAAVAAVLVRLLSLSAQARPDEAGYLLVAQQARRGGPFLYGDLWVDRPPLLIAFFRVADSLGGLVAVRLLALVPVVLLVLAAGHAGSDARWTSREPLGRCRHRGAVRELAVIGTGGRRGVARRAAGHVRLRPPCGRSAGGSRQDR